MLKFEVIQKKEKKATFLELRKNAVDEFNKKYPDVNIISIMEYKYEDVVLNSLTLVIYFQDKEIDSTEITDERYNLVKEMKANLEESVKRYTYNFNEIRNNDEIVKNLNKETADMIKKNYIDKKLIWFTKEGIHLHPSVLVEDIVTMDDIKYSFSDMKFLCYLPFISDVISSNGTYHLIVNGKQVAMVHYKGMPENDFKNDQFNLGIKTEIEFLDKIQYTTFDIDLDKEDNS